MSPLSLTLTKWAVTRARGERWPSQEHKLFSYERRLSPHEALPGAHPGFLSASSGRGHGSPQISARQSYLLSFWGQDYLS